MTERFTGLLPVSEQKKRQQALSEKAEVVTSFVQNTEFYRAGARQRLSLETYKLPTDQVNETRELVSAVQGYLAILRYFGWRDEIRDPLLKTVPPEAIKYALGLPEMFRLDMVEEIGTGRLFISEIQVKDGGLPAMAIMREAYGRQDGNNFPGVVETYVDKLKSSSQFREDRQIVIAFDPSNTFYPPGFEDVAQLVFERSGIDITVLNLTDLFQAWEDGRIYLRYPSVSRTVKELPIGIVHNCLSGYKRWPDKMATIEQEILYAFTMDEIDMMPAPNPLLETKLPLALVWDPRVENLLNAYYGRDSLGILRRNIPPTYIVQPDGPNFGEYSDLSQKDSWVVKSALVDQAEGVFFGREMTKEQWGQLIKLALESDGGYIIQKYIESETFYPIEKSKRGGFQRGGPYNGRVEAYALTIDDKTILADMLYTGLESLKVHGRRDCVMVPIDIE